jgi:hypothetical protein
VALDIYTQYSHYVHYLIIWNFEEEDEEQMGKQEEERRMRWATSKLAIGYA